jgi:DNA-binding MarR family transcriptional regulator
MLCAKCHYWHDRLLIGKKRLGGSNPSFGIKNGQAKVTDEQVKEIRELYRTMPKGNRMKELAKRFGISPGRVKDIANGYCRQALLTKARERGVEVGV